ncbi:MAG: hypothetical protein IPP47_08880 [Bryobacterales bacterium]|nr:hypothetical protein [Bryobacterales bacterium]
MTGSANGPAANPVASAKAIKSSPDGNRHSHSLAAEPALPRIAVALVRIEVIPALISASSGLFGGLTVFH